MVVYILRVVSEIAQQVSESGLYKYPGVADVVNPLAGKLNMLTTEGAVWKRWRSIFNPGFSIQQVITQVPT
jgi:cytochrome P450